MSNPPNDVPNDVVVEGDVNKDGRGLQHGLSNRHLQLMALGGAIDIGMFMGSSNTIDRAGPSSMLVYVVVGFFLYLVMRVMGEMPPASPRYRSFRGITEDVLGLVGGFIAGWTYWFTWIVVVMGDLATITGYAQFWWPEVLKWLPVAVLALLLPVLNVVAVRYLGEMEFWFALIKLVAVEVSLIVVVSLLFSDFISKAERHAAVENLWNDGGPFPSDFPGFLTGSQIVSSTFVGLEVVDTATAETHSPECSLPETTNAIPIRPALFYTLALAVICMVIPWYAVAPGESPFTAIFQLSGFGATASVMDFVLLTAAVSSDNSGLYFTSRMTYGLAEDRQAPRIFGKLSRRNAPQNVLICPCLLLLRGIGFLYASETISQVFVLIASTTSVLSLSIWAPITMCYTVYRKKHPELYAKSTYRASDGVGTTWMTFVFLAVSLIILCLGEETLRAVLMTPIWLVIIIPCYFTNKARDQRTAPVERQ